MSTTKPTHTHTHTHTQTHTPTHTHTYAHTLHTLQYNTYPHSGLMLLRSEPSDTRVNRVSILAAIVGIDIATAPPRYPLITNWIAQ